MFYSCTPDASLRARFKRSASDEEDKAFIAPGLGGGQFKLGDLVDKIGEDTGVENNKVVITKWSKQGSYNNLLKHG